MSMQKMDKKSLRKQQLLWVVLLWLAVIFSAQMVVYATYDTRNKFSELEMLRVQHNALQIEWGRYLLEESAHASYGRIEKIAIDQLAMQIPDAKNMIVVTSND